MSQQEPSPKDPLRHGPIRAVRVHAQPTPVNQTIVETHDHRCWPFEQIKHLIGERPLQRSDLRC